MSSNETMETTSPTPEAPDQLGPFLIIVAVAIVIAVIGAILSVVLTKKTKKTEDDLEFDEVDHNGDYSRPPSTNPNGIPNEDKDKARKDAEDKFERDGNKDPKRRRNSFSKGEYTTPNAGYSMSKLVSLFNVHGYDQV
jgi:hypothetical protein